MPSVYRIVAALLIGVSALAAAVTDMGKVCLTCLPAPFNFIDVQTDLTEVIAIILFLILAIIVTITYWQMSRKIDSLVTENKALTAEVVLLRGEIGKTRDQTILELRAQIAKYLHVAAVEQGHEPIMHPIDPDAPTPPLLVVMGTDKAINEREQVSVMQSSLDYNRLLGSDGAGTIFAEFLAELNRRRQDNTLYKYIVFAMHGGTEVISGEEQGVLAFRDRNVGSKELAPQLQGVKIVQLSSCATTLLADDLVGIVDHVISFKEGVDNQDAGRFDRALWDAINAGLDPRDAYAEARSKVPAVKRFCDIQSKQVR